MSLHINDNVILKTLPQDDLWRVVGITPGNPVYVTIEGITIRLIKVTPVDQVETVDDVTAMKILAKNKSEDNAALEVISKDISPEAIYTLANGRDLTKIPGTILHLDSDPKFLKQCLDFYKEKNIIAHGYSMEPIEMPRRISELLNTHNPDILVITGHDGLNSKNQPYLLKSYINSKYYVEAVKQARRFDRSKDSLIIFAGACQSFYEALMNAGANFASSPKRVNIRTYDPAVIAVEVALTPILTKINPAEAIAKSKSDFDKIGGIESIGTLRTGVSYNIPSTDASTGADDDQHSQYDDVPVSRCPFVYAMKNHPCGRFWRGMW